MRWENDGVPFAVDASGTFRDVAEVTRGLSCGCYCADCKGPLVAKKGEIKIHHFAHHDRRDCRHALEASLFGMIMTLAQSPGAALMVPPCGDRHQLVPRPDQIFTDAQEAAFFRTRWVIEGTRVSLESCRTAGTDMNASAPEIPEIEIANVQVHVLSHRKREADLVPRRGANSSAVLLLDLRDYAARWWSICDAQKGERIEVAKSATQVMRGWLESDVGGRTWLFHPELEAKKRELKQWIAEKSWVAAERRRRESLLVAPKSKAWAAPKRQNDRPSVGPLSSNLPPQPSPPSSDEPETLQLLAEGQGGDTPLAFARRVKDSNWLTTHLAAEFKLWQDRRTGCYVVLGRPGERLSSLVEDMIDPTGDWEPVSAANAHHFASAKQLLRASRAPYGFPPSGKGGSAQAPGR
jgi:hypothetical protein